MIKFFSNNQILTLVLVPIFVLLHLLMGYYFPEFGTILSGQDNLWKLDFTQLSPFYSKLLAFLFIYGNSILINFVFNTLEFHGRVIFLPGVLYIFIIFLFPNSLNMGEAFLAQLFFILSFYQLLSIRQNDDARDNAFLSGLFLGLSATFTPVNFVFILLIWMGVFIIRPFVLREFLLPIFGFLLPFSWVYYLNPSFLEAFFVFNAKFDLSIYHNYVIYIPFLFPFLLSFIALKNLLNLRIKNTVRFKRITLITLLSFLFFLFFGVLLTVLYENYSYFILIVVVLPFILPFAYLKTKSNWISEGLFYGLILINVLKFFIHELL